MTDFILVDTSVLSEARRAVPDTDVIFFLHQVPDGGIAVPPVALFELARGAVKLSAQDPERARELVRWIEMFLETDVYVPPIDAQVKLLLARMAMTPELRKFWVTRGAKKRIQYGCDPEIAAIAIIYQFPIATLDVSDFLRIHRHFPLPGLYCPRDGRWHVMPQDGWAIISNGKVPENDWHHMITPII